MAKGEVGGREGQKDEEEVRRKSQNWRGKEGLMEVNKCTGREVRFIYVSTTKVSTMEYQDGQQTEWPPTEADRTILMIEKAKKQYGHIGPLERNLR